MLDHEVSVKTKATTDASFLNLETTRVSKYSSSKHSSFGNFINFSLNFKTLPSRNSLNSDIASPQHFIDKMLKACVRYFFIKFLFFHQMIGFPKLWRMLFISSKKLSSFSRYSNFCNFFPFFSTLSRFKRANGSGIIYVINWLA